MPRSGTHFRGEESRDPHGSAAGAAGVMNPLANRGCGSADHQGNIIFLDDQQLKPGDVQELPDIGDYRVPLRRGEGCSHRPEVAEPILTGGILGR